jgi:hypothetical protein
VATCPHATPPCRNRTHFYLTSLPFPDAFSFCWYIICAFAATEEQLLVKHFDTRRNTRYSESNLWWAVSKTTNEGGKNYYIQKNIVMDFIKALPDNGSVNSPTYMGGQQSSGRVLLWLCQLDMIQCTGYRTCSSVIALQYKNINPHCHSFISTTSWFKLFLFHHFVWSVSHKLHHSLEYM